MPKKPEVSGSPRSVVLNSKVTPEEEIMIRELAKASGITKSELFRKALLCMVEKFPEVSMRVSKQIPKLMKEGKLSAGAISTIYGEEFDVELAEMTREECKRALTSKGKSKKSIFEEVGKKAAML